MSHTTEKPKLLVAVYGTLKKGFPNHANYLGTAHYWGHTTLRGLLLDLYAYPGFVVYDGPGSSTFTAEVYEIEEADLAALDRLENHPNHFMRVKFKGQVSNIPDASGDTKGLDAVEFWVYTIPQHAYCKGEFRLIDGSVWKGQNAQTIKYARLFPGGISLSDNKSSQLAMPNGPYSSKVTPVKTSNNTVFPILRSLSEWGKDEEATQKTAAT